MNRLTILFLAIAHLSLAQEKTFLSEVKDKSAAYFEQMARVKLQLSFNQTKYAPGDTACFRVVYLNAADMKPVKGSQVVHVFLFDQGGAKKLVRRLLVTDGLANVKMMVPQELAEGNYVVVAFTDWMKNIDPLLYFRQPFLIAGKNIFERKAAKDSLAVVVEGGTLVDGLDSNLGIRYTGSNREAKAIVLDGENNLGSFKLHKDSVTLFKLKPMSGKTYSVDLCIGDRCKKYPLPTISPQGVAISCDITSDRARINIECSPLNEFKTKQFYLLVFNSKGLAFQKALNFTADFRNEVQLPAIGLGGVSQVIVVDSNNKLWSERVIYISSPTQAGIKIEGLASAYATSDPVKLNVQMIDKDGQALNGVFGINVINSSLATPSMISYLNLQSDISNSFEMVEGTRDVVGVNNYLITQTCPWFNWKKLAEKGWKNTFTKKQYATFSGVATHSKTGLPLSDSTMLLFFLENNLKGYETYTDGKGKFSFPLTIRSYSNDRLFYTGTHKEKDIIDDINIKIDDPDSLLSFYAEPVTTSATGDPYTFDNSRQKIISNSYSFFLNSISVKDSTYNPNKPIEDLLRGVDINLNISDYLMMPTMEEVLREILKSVEYRKIKGRDVVRVVTTYRKPTSQGAWVNNYAGPLYVIDGQITKSTKIFMSLKPADILTIKVVRNSQRLMALGKLGTNGVIIVKTKSHANINDRNKIPYFSLLPASSYYPKVIHDKKFPDFRPCLYWSPYFQVGSTGSTEIQFEASMDVGKYLVQIVGLTENGTPVYTEQPFTLSFHKN